MLKVRSETMITEKLYDKDSHIKAFTAKVIDCRKNEKGFEALGPKGFGYLYYASNRNLASKPAAKIHLFFE